MPAPTLKRVGSQAPTLKRVGSQASPSYANFRLLKLFLILNPNCEVLVHKTLFGSETTKVSLKMKQVRRRMGPREMLDKDEDRDTVSHHLAQEGQRTVLHHLAQEKWPANHPRQGVGDPSHPPFDTVQDPSLGDGAIPWAGLPPQLT